MSGGLSEPLDLTLDGPVAVVTLNAPPLNIFDLTMRDELIGALAAVDDLPHIRALVLRSAGRHFCAGADLSEFGQAETILEGRRIRWDRDPWGPLADLRVPTVVALHGTALGSGLELSLLCDLRVAAADARLGLPETKLGMLPAAGGTQSLTAAVGPHAALPPIALGATIGAEDALRLGLVHRLATDADAADGVARELADRLAGLDPDLVRAARRALRAAGDLALDAGLAYERRLATVLAARRDAPEERPDGR